MTTFDDLLAGGTASFNDQTFSGIQGPQTLAEAIALQWQLGAPARANAAGAAGASASNAAQGAANARQRAALQQQRGQAIADARIRLATLNQTIANDIRLANQGFEMDTLQFNSNLRLQREMQNTQKSLEIAELAGSGDARDNIANLLARGSGGATPGAFSGFSGLPSPFLDVNEGQIQFNPIEQPDFTTLDFDE